MRLRGQGIYLRPLVGKDAPALVELLTRNRDFFRAWEPARPDSHLSLAVQRGYLEAASLQHRRDDGYAFGIFDESDRLIGRVNLNNIVRAAFCNAYIGYYIDHEENGKGYMTQAVDMAVGFAFDRGALHRVQAAVMPGNTASIRVVEKVGFRLEGFAKNYLRIDGAWRDHRIYAITVEDRLEKI